MKKILFASLAAFLMSVTSIAGAEDLDLIFKRVNEFIDQKNYSKAMDELDWARKEIEKMHLKRVQEFLPDNLAGMKGEKFDSNSMLGFSNIERDYTQAKQKVKVSLISGTGEGPAAALGGLAQLGRMAVMFGAKQAGAETVRIQGRTATVEGSDNKMASVTVMLDSGSILKFESSGGVKVEQLKNMAEAVKIEELDAYLKGAR